nr:S1 RNA-binding domain-containing protein 1 isoform X1 [Vanessa tameamea]
MEDVDSRSRKRKIKDVDDENQKPSIKKRITTKASSKKLVTIKELLSDNSEDDKPKKKVIKKQIKKDINDDKPKRKIIKKQSKKELDVNDDTDNDINLNREIPYEECNSLFYDAEMLSNFEKITPVLAQKFISLINEGCTLPFIARYRKETVDHLMPDRLQDIYESYQNVLQFKKKVKSVLETLRKSKKLTPEIEQSILKTKNLSELDLVYGPLKSHSVSLAERARNLGLEKYAVRALNDEYIDLNSLCDGSEELSSVDKIETHIMHIVADIMYKDARVLQQMRTLKEETRFTLQSSRTKSSTKEKQEGDNKKLDNRSDPETYKLYFDWKCPVAFVKCYQTLAVNRGEEEKILSVKVIIPDWFYNRLERFCQTLWRSNHWVNKGLGDAYNRLIKPWLSRQVRSELTNAAQKEAVKTFSTNLEKYLLTEPIKNRNIAGLDPGFKAGCKVGIIDNTGMKLEACNIYPNFHCNNNDPAVNQLRNLLKKHRVELIGLGNGTACRETESWLKKHYISDEIPVIIVPEQGASIYSISKEAQKEHPNMDPNLISALSIARRVLDPLGELIKVEPKNLGVGLYQHDIPPKMLESVLDATVEKVVSLVGVDINTASQAMLRRISGLNESRAKKIISYRQDNGSFKMRAEILKVSGIGKITYQQCAGFLKVLGGSEPLDSTIVHPESYTVAKLFAKKIGVNIKDLTKPRFPEEVDRKVATIDHVSMSKDLNTDISTLELIVNAFKQKTYEDNMITFCRPVYSLSVQAPDQLKKGTSLTGVVRNVVPFGCFVDCGVGDNGLIHTSKMGNATLKLGDRVAVTVIATPKPKKLQLKLDNILD